MTPFLLFRQLPVRERSHKAHESISERQRQEFDPGKENTEFSENGSGGQKPQQARLRIRQASAADAAGIAALCSEVFSYAL